MKSDMKDTENFERYYIECSCRCNNILVIDIDEDPFICNISMHYDHRLSFFKRLYLGVRYIFRGKDLIMWDCIIINKNNINQLEHIINKLKEIFISSEKRDK